MVEQVAVPAATLAAGAFAHADYADAYRVRLPGSGPRDLDALVRATFTAVPGWVSALMRLRDMIVSLIGLKTARAGVRLDTPLQPGASLGVFRVFARSASEILLGEDDRHLDFRVGVLLERERGADWVTVSTVVRFNSWLGRAYFLPVRPLHRLIVPAMMRSALRRQPRA